MGGLLKFLIFAAIIFYGGKYVYASRQAHALAELQAKTEDAQYYYVHPEDTDKIHVLYNSSGKTEFYDTVAVGTQTRYLDLPSGRTLSYDVSREITGYCPVDGHPFYQFHFKPLKPIKVIDATGKTVAEFGN
ncbi:MAG TPA: hypothetical protein VL625_09435 [Patescibacteria group bacterium]|nr:hypothetical protein [Patescibacteria group bacterium]